MERVIGLTGTRMGRNEQKQLENFINESRDFFLLVSWLLLAVNFLLNLPWTCLDHDLRGDGGGLVHYGGDKVFSWSARVQGGDGGGRVAARCSSVKTLMVPPKNLGPDLFRKPVNETLYRGMIGSLMYLTLSRPDIQFLTCLCARYQANPKESHLIVVKRIFRYLKGTPSLGLWYPKGSGFDFKGYSDSNYVGCNMDRKSTSGAC
ncbi:hypothetical protein Tco_1400401 [Tanacetum coccineum]